MGIAPLLIYISCEALLMLTGVSIYLYTIHVYRPKKTELLIFLDGQRAEVVRVRVKDVKTTDKRDSWNVTHADGKVDKYWRAPLPFINEKTRVRETLYRRGCADPLKVDDKTLTPTQSASTIGAVTTTTAFDIAAYLDKKDNSKVLITVLIVVLCLIVGAIVVWLITKDPSAVEPVVEAIA